MIAGFLERLPEFFDFTGPAAAFLATHETCTRSCEIVDEVDRFEKRPLVGRKQPVLGELVAKVNPLLIVDVRCEHDLIVGENSGVGSPQHIDPSAIAETDEQDLPFLSFVQPPCGGVGPD